MNTNHLSVEVTACENGKNSKGTLTVFLDEFVFKGERTPIDWEITTCEQGVTKVKGFLFSSEKPYVVFKWNGNKSLQFILEQENMDKLLSRIADYAEHLKTQREERLEKARKVEAEKRRAAEEKRSREEKEARIREETRRKEEEESRRRKEEEEKRKQEEERREKELRERKTAEKKVRLQKEIESCKNAPGERITVNAAVKKIAGCFLDNPYRVLGVACTASNEEANQALDKLKKLARLKALESYRSPFDLAALEKPARDLSIAQNALSVLRDKNHKWFWFADADSCAAWYSGKFRMELSRDGQEFGTYDLFLANYMYAVVCDFKFETAETWKRVLNFYCYICNQSSGALLKSRFTEKELEGKSREELLADFKKTILSPLLQLCDTDDLVAVLRLHKYISSCENKQLDPLSRNVMEKVTYWFKSKENEAFAFLRDFDEENISAQQQKEIMERGSLYCKTVEKVFDAVLKELEDEPVRHEMIKESYRTTTYEFMFKLHKCADKSDAIYFANKTYPYSNEDIQRRIRNTFGEANIKVVDWSVPHTAWDIKGDDFYHGKGCDVDYTQAVYWYRKAAEAGNKHSKNSLGICYLNGNGVEQNDAEAVSWFRKAFDSDSADGAYNLAECYYEGKGVKKSINKALEYWAEAAKLGHPSAKLRRAEIFKTVQAERRAHRAKNHILHDIGFQMLSGTTVSAEVTINQPAYAYLVTAKEYQRYLDGDEFSYKGGFASRLPFSIRIPTSNHWYVIVDNGDDVLDGIRSSVKVRTGI